MDDEERTVISAKLTEGISQGTYETAEALHTALDLHAIHNFTHAAAVDGSMREQTTDGRRLRRRVSYGVWEGVTDDPSQRLKGLWGGRLPSDLEVADAEMTAVHETIRKIGAAEGHNAHKDAAVA